MDFGPSEWILYGGMAPAVTVSSQRAAFYNCRFIGWQDTLYDHKVVVLLASIQLSILSMGPYLQNLGAWQGQHFFKNCYIEGTVDFVCGGATSIYEV